MFKVKLHNIETFSDIRRKLYVKDKIAGDRKRISCLLYKIQLTIKLCNSKTYQQGFPRWFKAVLFSLSKAFFAKKAQATIGRKLRGTGDWSPGMIVINKHAPVFFLASQTFCRQHVESPNDFVQLMKYAPICSKEGYGVCQGTCAYGREGTILISFDFDFFFF